MYFEDKTVGRRGSTIGIKYIDLRFARSFTIPTGHIDVFVQRQPLFVGQGEWVSDISGYFDGLQFPWDEDFIAGKKQEVDGAAGIGHDFAQLDANRTFGFKEKIIF